MSVPSSSMNAIRWPLGDQARSHTSRRPLKMVVSPVPSAFTVPISPMSANAILEPSGDHDG